MKRINKRILDECIELSRLYWKEDATESLDIRIAKAKESGADWWHLVNLLDAILASGGFKHEASNWDIYLVLRLLGWEVVDEEIKESESL